jgi:hypothetical protein
MLERTKEVMDMVLEYTGIIRNHGDKVYLKITDGHYTNFGRSYYYIQFDIENREGNNERILYTMNTGRISFYMSPKSYDYIKHQEELDDMNNEIMEHYKWITELSQYFLWDKRKGMPRHNIVPTLIKPEWTRIHKFQTA